MMIRTIPLARLVPSPRNVRRTTDPQADSELRVDIEARGLLQNLVVTKAAKPRGCFAVEAGERRRRALQALAEEGKLPSDHEVCCLVLEGGAAAQEASLAENFQRLSMNPADECLAFRQLVDQGSDAEAIARRFGLTVRFVEGRLRLADLAPVVFEALGAGEISLDVAKAYGATSDRERQAFVFEQAGRSYFASHPDSIRRMMTQATVSATDRRARLVGEEAYLAAGGRIERDLFSDEAGTRWLDIALLERLASEKLEAAAAEAAAELGIAFVRPTLDGWVAHSQTEGLRRVPVETPPLTDEETALVGALQEEMEALAAVLEDEETVPSAREQAETRVRELGDRIDAIVDKLPVIDGALRPQVGAFLVLDEHGRPKLDGSFYVPDTAPEDAEDGVGQAPGGPEGASGSRPSGLSQRLADELAMQRRDVLAVHVAADPALALDLAIFLMIDRDPRHREPVGSSLTACPPPDPIADFSTPEAAASLARSEAADALDRSWSEGATRSERFDAFRALPEEARGAWLGHAVARTLGASIHAGNRACPFHDHLGRLLGIEVARWWRPTGANYFDRVPKSVTLAALTEIGGPALADRYGKARKAELSQACERIFAGDFIGEVEVKEAALAWVPEAMRFVPADAGSGDGAGGDPDGQAGLGEHEPAAEGEQADLPPEVGEAA